MAELALGAALVGSALYTSSRVQAAKATSQMANVEAQSIEEQAGYNERQQRRLHKLAQGQANAQAAASGVQVSSGSPLFLELDRIKQGALDSENIKRSGRVAATGKRFEGELARKQIPGMYFGGLASAGSALGTFLSR